jgi:DNA modification methylase
MEIIEGNYGKCYICDNMDKNVGLPSLNNKSWELCFTDPPYNCNYNPHSQENRREIDGSFSGSAKLYEVTYNDVIDDYPKFCNNFYDIINRTCNKLIFTPGNINLGWWLHNYPPIDWGIHYTPNGKGCTHIFQFVKKEVILFYGNFKSFCFIQDVWNIYINNGALNRDHFTHTSPKSIELWKLIIKSVNPKSIIDPFGGSGTTFECAEELGIPWLGYEINPAYIEDIRTRVKRGILAHKNSNTQSLGEY